MTSAASLTQPRLKTVKRLFAVARNRCAFKKCRRPLVEASGVVVGEICHIKGRPGGPRFDPNQRDEERHGYDNLILMCPEHHKVIDDDVATYTADVLSALKKDHEVAHLAVDVDDVAVRLLLNSGFAGEVHQTAGDHGINVAAAHSSVTVNTRASALNERRVEAAHALWKAVLGLRDAVPGFVGSRLDIVTDAEYPAMYRHMQDLIALVDQHALAKALHNPAGSNVADFSPFLPSALWEQFAAYRVFIGRVCFISTGRIGQGIHWTRDVSAMEALRNALGAERVTEVLGLRFGRLQAACSMVQSDILNALRVALS